jgi:hypothetical protein
MVRQSLLLRLKQNIANGRFSRGRIKLRTPAATQPTPRSPTSIAAKIASVKRVLFTPSPARPEIAEPSPAVDENHQDVQKLDREDETDLSIPLRTIRDSLQAIEDAMIDVFLRRSKLFRPKHESAFEWLWSKATVGWASQRIRPSIDTSDVMSLDEAWDDIECFYTEHRDQMQKLIESSEREDQVEFLQSFRTKKKGKTYLRRAMQGMGLLGTKKGPLTRSRPGPRVEYNAWRFYCCRLRDEESDAARSTWLDSFQKALSDKEPDFHQMKE